MVTPPLSEASPEAAFEALMRFWEDAGLDAAEARALARRGAPSPAAPSRPAGPAPSPKPSAPRRVRSGPVEAAQAIAGAVDSVDALAAAIQAFDGCPLKAAARTTVTWRGQAGAPVLVIGDAPDREDDEAGRAWAGAAGRLLDRMLAAIGLSAEAGTALLTQAVFWRPAGDAPPAKTDLAICKPFLQRLIALSRPKALLVCGDVAAATLLGRTQGALQLRGQTLSYDDPSLTAPLHAMVTLKPAYLLSRPLEKRLAWADLQGFEAELDRQGVMRGPRP